MYIIINLLLRESYKTCRNISYMLVRILDSPLKFTYQLTYELRLLVSLASQVTLCPIEILESYSSITNLQTY